MELMDRSELKTLSKGGDVHYVGASPLYNGVVAPLLSHIFATKSTFLQEDGDLHFVVDSLEILDKRTPKRLASFVEAPELVRAFAAMYPAGIPAGWWTIGSKDPETIRKQLVAFLA